MSHADALTAARDALGDLDQIVRGALVALAATADPQANQTLLYDLSHASAEVQAATAFLDYGEKGDTEAGLAITFAGIAVRSVAGRAWGNERQWDTTATAFDRARAFVADHATDELAASLANSPGSSHLDDDFTLVADTFRRFGEEQIMPHAEHVHRNDLDVPESIISGLAELGCFGLSIPAEYGGFAEGTDQDTMAMVIATEELSRAALAIGGSLITRPEILARAIETGGTEEQKRHWLPQLASGEIMAAVAVTEPDYGSDVAGLKVTAKPTEGGWLVNGVKTWCTFAGRADVLMVLARTEDDKTHRGLSLLIVPKERTEGHSFDIRQDAGGRMEGRAIPTLGYRGMHSFEVSIEDWFVPADNLIGLDEGQGRGFYLQMAGFENGRLQTAARACGVMQRAYEEAVQYCADRKVFGLPLDQYQLTQVKLGHMAATVQAVRQYSYLVAGLFDQGEGTIEAAMIKAFACRAAEWVTREAMQLHGGFGYAEEYTVSRLFVDARVLSIFEGADETLCLKLIGRRLLANV